MAIITPQSEALIHLARKRRLLDVGGGARLRILLAEQRIASPDDARRFLLSGVLPEAVSVALLSALPIGSTRMGPYQRLAHLADGGMGSVWLVTRRDDDDRRATPLLDRPAVGEVVVAKSLHARFAATEEARRRFDREARLMAELRHPHVVAIRDLEVTEDGSPFMVMDFVDSGDLKDLVDSQGPLAEYFALAIVHQVAEGVAEAHARGIIHRDIKPANVFVRGDGWATLADFGLARSTAVGSTVLTMEGTQIGSPLYMSPEQIRARTDVDERSDLYSLGCMLYFCLTGTPPFVGSSVQDVQHQHLTALVPDVTVRRPGISAHSAAIITRLMSKDRAARFASAAATCVALRSAMTAAVVPGRPTGVPSSTPATRPPISAAAPTPAVDPLSLLTSTGDEGLSPALVAQEAVAQEAVAQESVTQQGGMDQPWIALLGEGVQILLYARHELMLGKLCEPPVDICLRKYPVERHRDDCLRIGRNHLRLRYAQHSGLMEVIDQGSTHGTTLDGVRLPQGQPTPVPPSRVVSLVVAGSLNLACQVHVARLDTTWSPTASVPSADASGIESSHALDACVITRPDNHLGMAYAMVIRRLTVGARDAQLPVPGVMRSTAEISLIAGRWVWRCSPTAGWQPLIAGMSLDLDGCRLRAVPGHYDHFVGSG